ncbi:hypothetical protein C8J56DRAFT_446479 [Mycena floridula]|nr:hypothetical protein C8J56DRAFT_446479 [Mycena floridula]
MAARRSSGLYEGNQGSTAAFASDGDQPAGFTPETAAATPAAAQRVPFWKTRKFIISQIIIIPLGIVLLFVLLFPVVTAIAQLVINRSQLNILTAEISSPQNGSFQLHLTGFVSHTGIIPATISFTEPIDIVWFPDPAHTDDSDGVALGQMNLPETLHAHGKRAQLDQLSDFTITDQDAFGRFAQDMITKPSFTWGMTSKNLRVQAAKFPVSHGLKFKKSVVLNGFNSFQGGVILKDFQMPSDNPSGGINFIATTQLNNSSPFALNLGTVVFSLSYQDLFLGIGTGTDTVIVNGSNDIVLKGVLVPQNGSNLATVSQLFTNYINSSPSTVVATGMSTLQADNSSISWLSTGLTALHLDVPFSPMVPLNPINAVSIGDFSLQFSEETPWAPAVESKTIEANLFLPFGFDLSVGQIQNDFNISRDGISVSNLQTPLGASQSKVNVLGPQDTEGTINITVVNTNLTSVGDEEHNAFSAFNVDLTSGKSVEFRLIGNSRAIANMSIGQITLDPIKVNVSTSLQGLQGLSNNLTRLTAVDVVGGTKAGIVLAINVAIDNPSNLNINTGDLSLQLTRSASSGGDGKSVLGTALLPKLSLVIGPNALLASSSFDANSSPDGFSTLNDFVGGKDVGLTISGYAGSTNVTSLSNAFKTLSIDVILPGLKSKLLQSAALKVLNSTGTTNVSHVSVVMANPFSTPLHITAIKSTVSAFGINLGSIDTAQSSPQLSFSTAPKSTTSSPELDLAMNFDPSSLFTLTRVLAVKAGMDPAPIDGIVHVGGIQYLSGMGPSRREIEAQLSRRANLFTGFNLPSFVQKAFTKLVSDVELSATVQIGDYVTTLTYKQADVQTHTDSSLNLILPVLAQPIVQKIVDASALGIETVLITNPEQSSFGTKLKGGINNAGPFDALIAFPSGLSIAWNGKKLGALKMPAVNVVGDVGAAIENDSTFQIADTATITDFTKAMLTQESFVWDISAEGLTVSALGIDVNGIGLSTKSVTLKGMNGLKGGVTIKTFDLPKNDPAGGIHLTLEADTVNPSQVGVQLSTLGFETFVGDVMIAPVASGQVTLAPLSTTTLSLVGRLIPQSSSAGLDTVSDVFNKFVQGQDSAVSVRGSAAGPASATWLNDGIKALSIDTVLPNRGKLQVIKSIDLNELELFFTEATAYSPKTTSKSATAAFTLPFAFPLDITALEQTITVSYQDKSFAQLAIPKGPSSTDVDSRIIHLTFADVPFAVFDDGHSTFDDFVAATTVGKTQTMGLSGAANADANTAVGLLSLKDIGFSVSSSIDGLQGLNARPVTVANLDVNHGFSDYLLIKVDSALFNPSNLTIGTEDVEFDLQFLGESIGSVDMSNLIIKPGNGSYPTDVHYSPQGGAVDAGQTLLENFLQGIDSATTIAGTTSSTPIGSLKSALSQIHLSPVTIPALRQTLIKSASLTFPTDIVKTGIAQATFTLDNPFTAAINLLKVGAKAIYGGNLLLGTIDNVDVSSNPIHADGHSSVTSPSLPLKFNLEPSAIIALLTAQAKKNSVDLGPLVQMFQFILANPNSNLPIVTTVDPASPQCVSGNQFNVAGAILKSLTNLKVDLAVNSDVKLDDFGTPLSFNQTDVTAVTDQTALFLIGAVAAPVAQNLVDGSVLKFTEANITNISDDGFDLSLVGSLTNVGPLDAQITFVEPLTVTWQGKDIAQITLPPVCASANTGVPNYVTKASLKITDLNDFTSFATFLLHNPSFDWTISTPKLRLTALGTIFDNVSLSKVVSFKAFNNLPGVTISNFQLPSDASEGGIQIETDALIPSPAQLGIDLGTVGFVAFFNGVEVGPLTASHLFLTANSQTRTHLSGRMIPQSGDDLEVIGELFSKFLAGENQTLTTKGNSVQPDGSDGPVSWLSTAFKTLELDVTLPGQKFEVIQSIDLSDLAVTLEDESQTFAPPTSSHNTVAHYKNPFGFSLQVIKSAETISLGLAGTVAAQLVLPLTDAIGGVSTGNIADLPISWENIPLQATSEAAFETLFTLVTNQPALPVQLSGTAQVVAKTAIGDVLISGIGFSVTSPLQTLNAFGKTAALSNVSITGSGGDGGNQFVVAPLTTELQNPSNISLQTRDISLPVFYQDVQVGRAVIDDFSLVPGSNDFATEFHYAPNDANDTVAQSFLTEFLTTDDAVALSIKGDSASSPFASLQPALSALQLTTSLAGLHQSLITQVKVTITLDSLTTNLVSAEFFIFNPLDTTLFIRLVQADGKVAGETFAIFTQPFEDFVVPPGQTVSSGVFGNVLLVQGALNSLGIIGTNLDIDSAATVQVGTEGGYEIPWLQLRQTDVPTSYDLALSLSAMKAKAVAISSSSAVPSSTVSRKASTAAAASAVVATASTVTATIDDTSATETAFTSSTTAAAENPASSS